MKRILFLAPLIAAILLFGSCKKVLGLFEFNVEDSQTIVIPKTVPFGQFFPLSPVAVSSSSTSTYAKNGTSADYVQDVTLDKLTLAITSPSGQNFDFLKRIDVYISTDAKGSDKVLLASLNPVPTGVSTISLTPADQKLDVFLSADSYTLTTNVEIVKPLGQDVTIRADERFKVKARKP
ncbi:hypothetical protein [Hymenobacter rubripertinctus]|uniref:Uncharacterized protein n=1 Tax=Hymenobacter rubripertinctus TaxID=2029981 RepID=A0A418QPH4_9BACT|nr:hypothetical protein [Hymenobacter rubripertinctus]RIY07074.1 hypothetical protein D0T11_17445 [Hymenobacter rubripertinctus]